MEANVAEDKSTNQVLWIDREAQRQLWQSQRADIETWMEFLFRSCSFWPELLIGKPEFIFVQSEVMPRITVPADVAAVETALQTANSTDDAPAKFVGPPIAPSPSLFLFWVEGELVWNSQAIRILSISSLFWISTWVRWQLYRVHHDPTYKSRKIQKDGYRQVSACQWLLDGRHPFELSLYSFPAAPSMYLVQVQQKINLEPLKKFEDHVLDIKWPIPINLLANLLHSQSLISTQSMSRLSKMPGWIGGWIAWPLGVLTHLNFSDCVKPTHNDATDEDAVKQCKLQQLWYEFIQDTVSTCRQKLEILQRPEYGIWCMHKRYQIKELDLLMRELDMAGPSINNSAALTSQTGSLATDSLASNHQLSRYASAYIKTMIQPHQYVDCWTMWIDRVPWQQGELLGKRWLQHMLLDELLNMR